MILEAHNLHTHFPVRNAWGVRTGWIRALDGVSLAVARGEILGIVGESGCGKSTLAKTICGVHRPTSGQLRFEGNEIGNISPGAGRKLRRHLQYCYQDPGASLDPYWTIGASLHEPLRIHTNEDRAARDARVVRILAAVGLPATHLDLYPHEISGGQQRRVGLARILMLEPSLVVLDEPTSGLDISVQAQVLRLLLDLHGQLGLTYLFISHDLSVVRLVCSRVAVMYLGRVVELGDVESVFAHPSHPYTVSLLGAVPRIGGARVTEQPLLEGEAPSPGRLPSGCRFRTRCPRAQDRCAVDDPMLRPLPRGQEVACHFPVEA